MDNERLLEKYSDEVPECGCSAAHDHSRTKPKRPAWSTVFLVVSNCALLTLSIILASRSRHISRTPSRNAALKEVSHYSPIFDQIDIPMRTVQHDNTLWEHTIYTQPPSDEVDEAWKDLSEPRFLFVDTETVRRIGKDPEYTVQSPDRPGQHVAMLAVSHQLHCLNSIRKNVFYSHYYGNGSNTGPLHEDHLQHCIDLLRQTLMCNANVDIITYNWWDIAKGPTPDFTVDMKCRDFNAIDGLMKQPFEQGGFFTWFEQGWDEPWHRPEGAKTMSSPRQWWELMVKQGIKSVEEFVAFWGEAPAAE